MNRKKWFSLIALICIVIAFIMYLNDKSGAALHDFFWIPLVLGAVFLFTATRLK